MDKTIYISNLETMNQIIQFLINYKSSVMSVMHGKKYICSLILSLATKVS